jgi:hypothetical protein
MASATQLPNKQVLDLKNGNYKKDAGQLAAFFVSFEFLPIFTGWNH